MEPRTDGENTGRFIGENTGRFIEENQRRRGVEARGLTVTMAEGALLAAAAAAAAAVALAAEGMDDESSDDEQLQSSPLGTAPPSLPPGPPDDAPDYHDAAPPPPPYGSAGYGGMAVSMVAALEAGTAPVNLSDLSGVDLSDLECLAELPDEVARAMFYSFTPEPSAGRGSGPNWAPCTDGRPFALEVKPEAAPLPPLPTSAPSQPGSFFMYGTSAQAPHGGPMPAQAASEIVAAHQHEMVASFLQHQHNSAGQTELAEDSFSSAMSEATTQQQFVPCSEPTPQHQFVPLQQHQFVPAPQFVRHNSSSSSLMSVAQQPTPDATCATVISEATSVLAVAQNLVPQHLVKAFPWQCPSSALVPPQGAPGGSGQLGTPMKSPTVPSGFQITTSVSPPLTI